MTKRKTPKPKTPKRTQHAIRINSRVYNRLKKECHKKRRGIGEISTEAIDLYLDLWIKVPKESELVRDRFPKGVV